MNFDFKQILDNYIQWIKDNSSIKIINDDNIYEITTPFLDRHNDHLQIYVKRYNNNNFLLTDDGYILDDLENSGVALDTPRRKKIFQTILNGYGVKVGENNNLYLESNLSNIGQKKHNLLQAMITVNDLYTVSSENVASLFKEDVENYFLSKEISYSKDIKITGKSGFDHNLDFIIARSKAKPERLIRTVNFIKKDFVLSAIMAFTDILAVREQQTTNMIIYNDEVNPPTSEIINAMKMYQITDIPWSKREQFVSQFTLN
jgi:hypothetical protein